MTHWKGRLIGAVGGIAVVVGGIATTAPTIKAHAATCPTETVQGSGVGLNPIEFQSDLTANPDPAYSFAGVCGFGVGSASAPFGNPEKAITVQLGGSLPGFPDGGGDIGITVSVCADMSGAIASGPVQVGVNHRGQPIYDGPWNPEDGWKYCTYATVQAGVPFDYGTETFNPNGNFTFTDYPAMKDAATGLATITPPSNTLGAGTTSVTLYLPLTQISKVNAPAPPLQGIARDLSEPYIGTSTANDLFALTQVNAEATLPFPVCINLNPPGIECNGSEIFGPVFGLAGILASSGWAPGTIQCPGFPNPTSCFEAGTGGFKNAVDGGVLPLPFDAQAFPTPCVDPLDNPIVPDECGEVGPTITNYNPCQSTNSGPNGQDVGDEYAILAAAGLQAECQGSSVPLVSSYTYQTGNFWFGDPGIPVAPAPAGGQFTLGPAFLFSGVNL